MNKQDIYNYIENKKIWYKITEHDAVFNMKDLSKIELLYPSCIAKNLFVCDDKKRNYYLITVKGDKRVDLKEFKIKNNTRALSLASEKDLFNIMNLFPGSVTPLGLLSDNDLKVTFYLDKAFFDDEKIIGIHPNDNTATLWIKLEDLVEIIKEHGNQINIAEF